MGKLSLDFKVILILCALVMVCGGADRVYSLNSTKLPWDKARNHCQVCYTDLVTLTPENIQHVQALAKNLTSGCWVGLRKNFTNSNSNRIWSRWANGDPLLFQNWYPGWPVFKTTNVQCCSGSGTTSTVSDTYVTDVTDGTEFSIQYVRVTNSDEKYIEDSCVAMLSFGAWVEKKCSERLPFICYEERFIREANVTSKTSEDATITWHSASDDISHYHIEVKGDNETRQFNTTNLTYDLVNLTAGTHYSVQVFPVKCERKLDAQKVEFYTTPNKVENLRATNVTETSLFLRWNQPAGNVDFYVIEAQNGSQTSSTTESKEIGSLTPGNHYTFTVFSGVRDKSTWSEKSTTSTYAKPGKVSNLRVSNNTEKSLHLSWTQPKGNVSEFLVTASDDQKTIVEEIDWSQTEANLTGLPHGSRITLTVAARVGGTVKGDEVTVVNYTAPRPITDLVLKTSKDSLNATWKSQDGNSTTFNVELQLDGNTTKRAQNLTDHWKHFEGLKNAANYTVVVYSFSGHLQGPAVQCSKFTKPSPPTNAKAVSWDKSYITFEWTAPENTATANYFVKINSSFWGQNWTDHVFNRTSYTFSGLTSGTKYDFEVRAVGDRESSAPTHTLSQFTVAEKREISLAMLCSSAEVLLCDQHTIRKDVFEQLKAHFQKAFGNFIFWKLEKQENKGTQEMQHISIN